jgi:L-rhamnose-H+ transport protein
MEPNPALGVLLHAIGGLMAASFYLPLKFVKNWRWENFWLLQGIVSWLIMPILVASFTIPDLAGVLSQGLAMRASFWAFFFGMLWGIGGLTFGLSMRYLGMSLGYALALGFCAAFGTMIPPLATGQSAVLFGTLSGLITVGGVAVCLAGITVCCFAGTLKEKELTAEQKKAAITEFALTKGFAVAIFAGIMSACMSFAITAGEPIGEIAVGVGANPIFQNNAVLVFVLAGGFTSNFIWCVILNIFNKSGGDYFKEPFLRNLALCVAGGALWYLQFFFYGMGTTKMGAYGFASWTIHMAFIIAFSNVWGLLFKEWKGSSRRVLNLVYAGIGVLVLSTCVVGVGNYQAEIEKKAAEAPKAKAKFLTPAADKDQAPASSDSAKQ